MARCSPHWPRGCRSSTIRRWCPSSSAQAAAASALSPGLSEPQRLLGTYLRKTGDNAGAIQAYRTAIAIDPANAWAHFNLGNALQPPSERIDAFRKAIGADPKHASAYVNLGLTLCDDPTTDFGSYEP